VKRPYVASFSPRSAGAQQQQHATMTFEAMLFMLAVILAALLLFVIVFSVRATAPGHRGCKVVSGLTCADGAQRRAPWPDLYV